MIVNSIDIEYYKDMKKRNEELSKTFQKAKQDGKNLIIVGGTALS